MTGWGSLGPVELRAAQLDGELFTVGETFVSVADADDAVCRAREFRRAVRRDALVADRRSAAWIWGALSRCPEQHTASLRREARVRGPFPGIVVREPVLAPGDVTRVGEVWVTTRLRTAVDLLRDVRPDVDALVGLVATGGVEVGSLRAAVAAGPIQGARRALRRLVTVEQVGWTGLEARRR
jgi:hypothetical protein